MSTNSVLLISALNLGLQVKIAGDIYLLKNHYLYRLDFCNQTNNNEIVFEKELINEDILFSDFLKLAQTMTIDEVTFLHQQLSMQGAIKHA